jgi:ubiquinone/menaquinone biosynthesis C-methylase UbiE
MNKPHEARHRRTIIDQFTRQAFPFTQVRGHLDAMGNLLEISKVHANDTVLDVACGPGLVTCAFARFASHVTGVDITPAMIEQATIRQQEAGQENIVWRVADVTALPYADDTFSLVLTRYSFHHLLAPEAVLREMIRVCRPGGRVAVADIAMEADKAVAFDKLELLRDPSHIHALTHEEFASLFQNSDLADCVQGRYCIDIELEAQLSASFPGPGGKDRLRAMIVNDIGIDSLGISARREDGNILYSVPVAVYAGCKKRKC